MNQGNNKNLERDVKLNKNKQRIYEKKIFVCCKNTYYHQESNGTLHD